MEDKEKKYSWDEIETYSILSYEELLVYYLYKLRLDKNGKTSALAKEDLVAIGECKKRIEGVYDVYKSDKRK